MIFPTLDYEKKLHKKGFNFIGGVDEVGRGSVAGPLVAACVVFDKRTKIPSDVVIRDSKTMTVRQKENADAWIRKNALTLGAGEVPVDYINTKGIAKATLSGFYRSVKKAQGGLSDRLQYLLIDGNFIAKIRDIPHTHQNAINGADQKIFSVAAASIVAKVYRDRLMERLGNLQEFAVYKWEKNKGYGTKEHKEALLTHGITKHHRTQFVESLLKRA